jgi:hypothetical protein
MYHIKVNLEKTCLSVDALTYNIKLIYSRWGHEMKSYNELKAALEAVQKQVVKGKRNE